MELPLFPLHTVLCPGIALPLHIFEDRYRALVRDCVEGAAPFGIVLIRDGREVGGGSISFSAIGTLAEIREARKYPDGRYDLLVVGTKRFAITDVTTDRQPYLVAEATVIDDEVGDEDAARRLANTATRRFVHYLELLQPREGETADEIDVRVEVETENVMPGEDDPDAAERRATGMDFGLSAEVDPESMAETDDADSGEVSGLPVERRVIIPDDPTTLSYLLSGIIQVELPTRQALLEADTTEERLRDLLGLIDRETFLLRRRLRAFTPTPGVVGPRRS
ncbi:MAG TPA: LON peptidase substrate-binding domain-containing protein [Candidatus Dormibacteraeota bacterium]|nr:LON peptidase substrate-binding domain-containing protein [Candidatus Dormibacteraeota bacterium]